MNSPVDSGLKLNVDSGEEKSFEREERGRRQKGEKKSSNG